MKHIRSLIYKFLLLTLVLLFILGFVYGVSIGDILAISFILTIAAYVLGDLSILPRFGNLAATVADFGLALFGVWVLGYTFIEEPIRLGVASFLSAILISVGEIFFHNYLINNVLFTTDNEQRKIFREPNYQTEIAEEQFPDVDSYLYEDENEDE
ncbi:YndM family protein [Bacillus kwashiorkori]|uniref:YndM family protein n=1 Tax=Bacillus kwashiorkori TaxID=1522318 RepID=UPI0007828951|nr:YndM family protein [Bacillus kwashiorkori]